MTSPHKTSSDTSIGSKLPLLGYRHLFALMGFLVFATINAQRLSFGVAIVAMVNHTAINENPDPNSTACPLNYNSGAIPLELNGRFIWSTELQGYIFAAQFVGFIVMQAAAGKMSECVRPIFVIITSIILSAVTTIATPFLSYWHPYWVIAVRFIGGMSQGALIPSVYEMMGNWFPVAERGFLSTIVVSGLPAGAFIGGLASGWICDIPFLGWNATFYIFGGLSLLLAVLFVCFYAETPFDHPTISKEELLYITGSLAKREMEEKRLDVPWSQIFRSIPVYALIIGLFGNYWILSYFITVYPTYLGAILHVNMSQNGLLSALTAILKLIGGLFASWMSDWLSKNDYLRTNKLRKICTIIGCFGFSACILGAYFAGCDHNVNTISLAISSLVLGFSLSGCMIAPVDMSPRFAGSLMGVVSCISSIANIIVPIVTGYMTKNITMEEWHNLFFVNIGVVLTCGLVFVLFGSAKVQPWNSYNDNTQLNISSRKKSENNVTLS